LLSSIFWAAALLVGTPLLIFLAILTFALSLGRKFCEQCGVRLPLIRKPTNTLSALIGGWTCKNCGAEVDADGRLWPPGTDLSLGADDPD
jgi:hypothetical protein